MSGTASNARPRGDKPSSTNSKLTINGKRKRETGRRLRNNEPKKKPKSSERTRLTHGVKRNSIRSRRL
jgi:hypothetical protein